MDGQTAANFYSSKKENNTCVISIEQILKQKPQLLKSKAGGISCSIFRLPKSVVDMNKEAYHPHIVSIGPYHHGKEHLRTVEEHKGRLLKSILKRTRSKGLDLGDFVKAIKPRETEARECYSEHIDHDSDKFVEMLILDSCFIAEVLRVVGGVVSASRDDPIFRMTWMIHFLMKDFLMIENQIPFFVLETIFNLSKAPGVDKIDDPLEKLAIDFFNEVMQRPKEVIGMCPKQKDKHLLDLFRCSFIPPHLKEPAEKNKKAKLIPCVTKLRHNGLKLKAVKAESFLEIKFRNGRLEIPTIVAEEFICNVFLNCIALEQCCCYCSKHFTTYLFFMNCLINTTRDVEKLCELNIIESYFGSDEAIVNFFNCAGGGFAFDVEKCYLAEEFEGVYNRFNNSWRIHYAIFKNTYFKNCWTFLSAGAALVLLILTFLQAFYAIFAYHHPRN